jgi:tetratricopeptide (TPR) repeat protein
LLKDYPQSPLKDECLFQLGQCFQTDPVWSAPDHAITWYQQLLAESPGSYRANQSLYEKGLCHEAVGTPEAMRLAVACYEQLIQSEEAEPWSTRALFRKAQVEERFLNEFELAAKDYEAFLNRESPENSDSRRIEAEIRLAALLAEKLNRSEESSLILSSILSERVDERWKAVARARMP